MAMWCIQVSVTTVRRFRLNMRGDVPTATPVRDQIVVRQPLQPFDIRNVTPGELGIPKQPFTFDPTVVVAARAALGERPPPTPFFSAPLPVPDRGDVSVAELLTFF